MRNTVILFILIISNLSFASAIITNFKGQDIYGCFNEIKTSKYESTTLIIRNDSSVSNDFIINEKDNKNSILIIGSYKSEFRETFEVSPLNLEAKDIFMNSQDGWDPKLYDKTFFTAKGNLKAFSIQQPEQEIITARYTEFASQELNLICTSNKKLVDNLYLKLIFNK